LLRRNIAEPTVDDEGGGRKTVFKKKLERAICSGKGNLFCGEKRKTGRGSPCCEGEKGKKKMLLSPKGKKKKLPTDKGTRILVRGGEKKGGPSL